MLFQSLSLPLLLLPFLLLLLLLLLLQVYSFKGGHVKPKNERFNKTPHPYELTFDEKAVITEIQETPDIPFVAYVTVAADVLAMLILLMV